MVVVFVVVVVVFEVDIDRELESCIEELQGSAVKSVEHHQQPPAVAEAVEIAAIEYSGGLKRWNLELRTTVGADAAE